MHRALLVVTLLGSFLAPPLAARDTVDSETPLPLEQVSIIGSRDAVDDAPGSAHVVDQAVLAQFEHGDVMRVLRQVGGVYVQDEEGFGLRPNIGIRGSGLDRSSRVTLMEDGVLAAPAPYAAPSAYYFPSMRRMHALEVLKGPASVRQGPRTIGGAVNLRSTPIPDAGLGRLEALGGTDGAFDGYLNYGGVWDGGGWLVEGLRQQSDGFKQLDGGGDTGFEVDDYVGKLRFDLPRTGRLLHTLDLKLGYYQQTADETYLGLTDEDFATDPYRRYAASALDRFTSRHRLYQAAWTVQPESAGWNLSVTAYHNDFTRSWFKLQSAGGTSLSAVLDEPDANAEALAWLRGDADSPDDALAIRDNNRSYMARGLQTVFSTLLDHGGVRHDLSAGLRVHEDDEDRFQDEDLYAIRDGSLVLTTDRPDGSQTNRLSTATVRALFIEDQVTVGRLAVTGGLRYEHIDLERLDYATDDPQRSGGPTRVLPSRSEVLIPGVGANWRLAGGLRLFGGVHKGFNPPAPGSTADAEESINYEFGARLRLPALDLDATAFVNDYDTLVGTCTASTGGNCEIGDQFEGGGAMVNGLELGGAWYGLSLGRLAVPLRVSYTWTATAEFDDSFESDFEPWGNVTAGDRMPYIPEHQAQVSSGLQAERWGLSVNGAWVDQVRTVAGQGSAPAAETVDGFFVMDLAANLRLNHRLDLFVRLDNALDNDYAVARRPAGLRPGKPRTALIGVRMDL